MSNVSTTAIDGTLFVDAWGLYRDLVHQMDNIPEDGAIYKKDLFQGLRDYIARLTDTYNEELDLQREQFKKDLFGTPCNYDIGCGWSAAKCTKTRPCPEHNHLKCGCGKQAVGGCSATGQFVCGAPRCEDHDYCSRHTTGY